MYLTLSFIETLGTLSVNFEKRQHEDYILGEFVQERLFYFVKAYTEALLEVCDISKDGEQRDLYLAWRSSRSAQSKVNLPFIYSHLSLKLKLSH